MLVLMPQDSASVHLRIYKKFRDCCYTPPRRENLSNLGAIFPPNIKIIRIVLKKWGLQSAPKIFHKKRKNKRLNKSDVDLALRARAIVRTYHSAVLHFVDNPCGAAVPYSKLALQ